MYEIELNKRKTEKTDESMRDREGGIERQMDKVWREKGKETRNRAGEEEQEKKERER